MSPKRYKPQRTQRRLKPKKSRLKKTLHSRVFWLGLACVCLIAGAAYGILFAPFLQLQHIEVEGAQKVPVERIEEIIATHADKNIFFVKTNSMFLINTNKIAEEVQASFINAESVAVSKKFPNTLKVIIKERNKVAAWCQNKEYAVERSDMPADRLDEQENGEQITRLFRQCFALDAKGVIFEEIESQDELVVESDSARAVLGQQAVDPELLARLFEFKTAADAWEVFREVGLRISGFSVIVPERVHARVSEGWDIYINPTENIAWQITKAQLVIKEEIPFERRPLLEYIDLRFGDQAYIKYR